MRVFEGGEGVRVLLFFCCFFFMTELHSTGTYIKATAISHHMNFSQ